MKRKWWIMLALAALLAALWCGTAMATDEYRFTSAPDCGYLYQYESFRIDWQTNFTPKKIVVYMGVKSYTDESPMPGWTYVPLSCATVGMSYMDAYYGDGPNDFVSADFSVDWEHVGFVQQPSVKISSRGTAFEVSWETGFVPDRVEIWKHSSDGSSLYATILEGFGHQMSHELPFTRDASGEYYYIYARCPWYSAYSSNFTKNFSLLKFTGSPSDCNVSPDGWFTQSWATSFTPVRVEIGAKISNDYFLPIYTLTENMSRGMSKDIYGLNFSQGDAWVRAYYRDTEYSWIESSFHVEKDIDSRFTKTPLNNATVYRDQSRDLIWVTNFMPWKVAISTYNEDGTYTGFTKVITDRLQLSPSMFHRLTWEEAGTGAGKAVIQVYTYGNAYLKAEVTINRDPCRITFNPEGGQCSVTSALPNSEGKLENLPVPTREGYSFVGWFYTNGDSTTMVHADTEFFRSTTLHANWTAKYHTVTVVDGTASCGSHAYTNQSVTITANEKPGMRFKRWTVKEGSATLTNATSATTTMRMGTTDVKVIATYEYIPVTVIFDGNGGVVSPPSMKTGTNGKLSSLPTPTREGYTFNYWYDPNGTGLSAMITTNTIFTEETTVKAMWTGIYHTITMQSGTSGYPSASVGMTVSITAAQYDSYTFDHWEVIEGDAVIADIHSASTTFVMGQEPVTIRAFFVYSGEYLTELYIYVTEPVEGGHPAAPTVMSDAYKASGYGWYDQSTGSEMAESDVFEPGQSYEFYTNVYPNNISQVFDPTVTGYVNDTADGVVTIYRHNFLTGISKIFTVAAYTVDFDADGGTGIMAPVDDAGRSYTLPECGFTPPENFVFDGWDLGQPGEVITLTGDMTLTAQWRQVAGSCGESAFWHLYDDGTLVISGSGSMADYASVPATSRPPWYSQIARISSIVIEDGITAIGSYSFADCTHVISVSVPSSVKTIGAAAFVYCTAMKDLTLEEGIETLGVNAFLNCRDLTDVVLPESVTSLGNYAFRYDEDLTEVTVLNPGMSFGSGCFANHSSSLVIRGYLNSTAHTHATTNNIPFEPFDNGQIGDDVYWSLSPSGRLIITGTGPMWDYTGKEPSPFCENLDIREVEIGEGVTTIGAFMFYRCGGITTVSIPGTVRSLGSAAFNWCQSLNHVVIPYGVTTVNGFSGCTSLTDITIPYSVLIIGPAAFYDCTALTDLDFIPDSVYRIRYNAFNGCTGLGDAVIPAGVSVLERFAFKNCTGMTSVTIPRGMATIEDHAFESSTGLQDVYYEGVQAEWDAISLNETGNETLLNAAFHCKLAVTFDTRGGTEVPMQVLDPGACAEEPETPFLAGCLFDGWYDNEYCTGDPYDFDTPVATDLTLYAHWIDPMGPDLLVLPENLSVLEDEAFSGTAANLVIIPRTVTAIHGDPFADSAMDYVYGLPGSAAEDFADSHPEYTFVPVTEEWMQNH